MKIILTFTLLMIPGVVSSISVTGYSGGGVKITCKYDEGYTENEKFFCRGDQRPTCSDLIKTETKYEWVKSGRFSLYDDTSSTVLKVTIRNLSEEDSGMYYCAADISLAEDPYTEVNLKVIRDQQIRRVRGYSGGNVTINFKYEKKHKNVKVCKTAVDQCFTAIISNRAAEWKQDRFSVHDDRSAGLLRVFIRELNVNDSGEYKITVKVSEEYSVFSEFNLDIRDDAYVPKTTNNSSLIVPLVLVLVVLIIAGLLLLFFCKKRQSRGSDSSSQTGPGKHEVVSHTGCDYEEIKDTHKQLPTSPSDSSATVEKATGDSQRCITSAEDLNYAVVNFHKESDCPDSVSIRNNLDYSEYTAVNHLTA